MYFVVYPDGLNSSKWLKMYVSLTTMFWNWKNKYLDKTVDKILILFFAQKTK